MKYYGGEYFIQNPIEDFCEKYSVVAIDVINDVTDPKMGLPNLSSQCSTCGAYEIKNCEGHFGAIKLPLDLFHPYFISETVQILNKVCPGCRSIKDLQTKVRYLTPCADYSTNWYPKMKFKVASRELFGKNASAIIVEVNERLPKKFCNKNLDEVLPGDYWDFIQKDPQQEETCFKSNRRTLSPSQVYYLLKDVDLEFIRKFVLRPESLFLTCIPVTPNCNRVVETMHMASNGQKLSFDERTKAYKRLVDFKRHATELGFRAGDCLNASKLRTERLSTINSDSSKTGLKWIKDVVLGKRTDYSFRMTLVGDPRIKLCEIGIPHEISERLLVSEYLNSRNWEELNICCNSHLLEKGEFFVRRKGKLVCVQRMDEMEIGDTIYRPLNDGDVVLINRPPSIHQHSLIALSVKVLPMNSVVSLNPLCCSPLRGDFDGDCLQCYIPQSVDSRVELRELVALDQQLFNGQNGRNLLSLSHDSLTAAYLVRGNDVFLNKPQIQQLGMMCSHHFPCPAILKAPTLGGPIWTGKQLFGMLLPLDFDFVFPMNGVRICKGEILSSSQESAWLQDTDGNIFCSLVSCYGGKALDILFSAQAVLLEWISMRGLSVSLSDVYLSSNSYSRRNMIEEVSFGLQEAMHAFHIKELLVDPRMEYLLRYGEYHENGKAFVVDHTCNSNKWSAGLSQVSIGAYREVFRDLQKLVYQYATKDNSMLAMVRAGSKGSLLKLVQQGLCLGLQHSSVPLSFKIPSQLSFATWNHNDVDAPGSSIPYAVVENSFLSGLNPLECFVHSLSSRDSSFGENADLPGSLTRKLMFYMRDLFIAYDGTVRNAYGNQLVQFSYGIPEVTSIENNKTCRLASGYDGFGGQPVGSLAACAISEAAYSALDQPMSTVEDSPLVKLKKVLVSGRRKATAGQTISLFLSKKLERWNYGSEYGAIQVKNHLERVFFSDVISYVMIVFCRQNCQTRISPWICHFHISEERMKRRGLNVQSIMDALLKKCSSTVDKQNVYLPSLHILSRDCCTADAENKSAAFCITVVVEIQKGSLMPLDTVRDLVMPSVLGTVIRGFSEFEKVEIMWNDLPRAIKSRTSSPGELYLRVSMSKDCKRVNFWSILQNACLPIMDLIDWERSYPDNIYDISRAYGIDAAWMHFLRNLKSATSDIGKSVLQDHLLLVADRLSVTGEFFGLNAKGITLDQTSTSSPFIQACFANPGPCFIKAAKVDAPDNLVGTLDAVAWGKKVPIGTGGNFDILYSGKGYKVEKPVDICNILCSQSSSRGDDVRMGAPNAYKNICNKWGVKSVYACDFPLPEGHGISECMPKSVRSSPSGNDILDMCSTLQNILNKYPINHCLSEADKSFLINALLYHPQGNAKMGTGPLDIKVGYHPRHKNSRCFIVVRTDGTVEDFSYRKCVIGAAQKNSPQLAKLLQTRFRNGNGAFPGFCAHMEILENRNSWLCQIGRRSQTSGTNKIFSRGIFRSIIDQKREKEVQKQSILCDNGNCEVYHPNLSAVVTSNIL
ncbi:RNA polymerase [Macleaya cordata]|uniref:DNA-directed RNA polymerase subunit n=1 Tax=Macleaya cordata TaxID=56857 RepID=A0A200R0A1_MACCD|nr:RNA polymerase [Macleaya cordata]